MTNSFSTTTSTGSQYTSNADVICNITRAYFMNKLHFQLSWMPRNFQIYTFSQTRSFTMFATHTAIYIRTKSDFVRAKRSWKVEFTFFILVMHWSAHTVFNGSTNNDSWNANGLEKLSIHEHRAQWNGILFRSSLKLRYVYISTSFRPMPI